MTNKTERQVSGLYGELATTAPAIDFAPGFNLEALKAVDPEPVFTTVKIRTGRGDQGQGPNYGAKILTSLQDQIKTKRPPGFRGHQDAEKVSWEWREPVTAWVGAQFVPEGENHGVLYVKGYVPPTAEELRTQLKLAQAGADVINSVSIFGTRQVEGDEVTDFDLWSLDWTPKGRAGMETELVSVSGEQSTKEDEDMDRDEILRSMRASDVPEHISGEIRKDERDKVVGEHQPLVEAAGEMRVILELDEDTDPEALVEAVRSLVTTSKDDELVAKLDEAVEGQIQSDLVRAAVKNAVLPKLTAESTDEEISGEIKTALDLEYIVALEKQQIPTVQGGQSHSDDDARQGTRWA